MKTITRQNSQWLIVALTLGAFSISAKAQFPGSGGPGGHHRPPPPPPSPLIMALDVNQDHVIEANEIANAASSLLVLDKNGDGQLTPDELKPQPPKNQARPPKPANSGTNGQLPPPPPDPVMQALDTNHDGTLSADELQNAPAALATLDTNHDGKLTMNELRPKPPVPPLESALDANHDGVISADEIANASAALKTLDKNGDGQLTRDEFCPPPPRGPNISGTNNAAQW